MVRDPDPLRGPSADAIRGHGRSRPESGADSGGDRDDLPEDAYPWWRRGAQLWQVIVVLTAVTVAYVVGLVLVTNLAHQIEQDRINRSRELNRFLAVQCSRDQLRDAVIIEALKDARARARILLHGQTRDRQIQNLTQGIFALQFISRNCVRTIPPITPHSGPGG